MKKYPLEERLIDYSVQIIALQRTLTSNLPGKHLGNQLIRSATSPTLNYAEVIAAESLSDSADLRTRSANLTRSSQWSMI